MKFENSDIKIKEGFVGQRMIVIPPNVMERAHNNALIESFLVTAAGYYPHACHHDRRRDSGAEEYIFIYCIKGKGMITIRGIKYEITPNTYFIIPKNEPHHYKASEQSPWSIYWFHFTGKQSEYLYHRYISEKESIVKRVPFEENTKSVFENCLSLLESGFGERVLEVANLGFLNFLASFLYYKELHPSEHTDDFISQSILFMKDHLANSYLLKDLADQQNLSISYYSELFKKKTGISPIQYFIQLKVQKSCQYLYFTNKSIGEICSLLGFEDQFYFSRIFKKTTGVSPAKYRGQFKNDVLD
jgi:AraC family transcriptional regulator of arabinose operon